MAPTVFSFEWLKTDEDMDLISTSLKLPTEAHGQEMVWELDRVIMAIYTVAAMEPKDKEGFTTHENT